MGKGWNDEDDGGEADCLTSIIKLEASWCMLFGDDNPMVKERQYSLLLMETMDS